MIKHIWFHKFCSYMHKVIPYRFTMKIDKDDIDFIIEIGGVILIAAVGFACIAGLWWLSENLWVIGL